MKKSNWIITINTGGMAAIDETNIWLDDASEEFVLGYKRCLQEQQPRARIYHQAI